MGSEDTLAFTQVLLAGGTIVYQPTAVTHHYHRRDLDGLRKQMVGLRDRADRRVHQPAHAPARRCCWPPAAAGAPGAAGADRPGQRPARRRCGDDFPRDLLAANRRGMLRGPRAYLRGRRLARGTPIRETP